MSTLNKDFQTLEEGSKQEMDQLHSQYSSQIDNMESIISSQKETQLKLQS